MAKPAWVQSLLDKQERRAIGPGLGTERILLRACCYVAGWLIPGERSAERVQGSVVSPSCRLYTDSVLDSCAVHVQFELHLPQSWPSLSTVLLNRHVSCHAALQAQVSHSTLSYLVVKTDVIDLIVFKY